VYKQKETQKNEKSVKLGKKSPTKQLACWLVSYNRRGSKGGRSRRETGLVSEGGAQFAPFPLLINGISNRKTNKVATLITQLRASPAVLSMVTD
jgi:hypothetical protein